MKLEDMTKEQLLEIIKDLGAIRSDNKIKKDFRDVRMRIKRILRDCPAVDVDRYVLNKLYFLCDVAFGNYVIKHKINDPDHITNEQSLCVNRTVMIEDFSDYNSMLHELIDVFERFKR